jgi:AsmA protein
MGFSMRKLAITGVVVCVVVVLLLALLPRFVDVHQYRPQIQAELESRLGRQVSLGDIRVSLLPPSIIVKDVVIAEDPRFGAGPFARAKELDVRVALLPLLERDVQVKSLRLLNPDIELIRERGGRWNYASMGQQPSTAAPPPNAPQQPKAQKPSAGTPQTEQQPGAASQLTLDHLKIVDGRLRLVDAITNTRNTYDNLDVTVNNFAPGKAFDVDGAVRIAGRRDQQIQVRGTAGPMRSGNAILPFDGTIKLKQVSLGDLEKVANVAALEGHNGIASGEVKAKTDNGVMRAEGSLKVDDPEIRNTKLGYPIAIDFKIDNDMNKGLLKVNSGTLKLGPTPVSFAGTMNTALTPAQLDMRVTTGGASLSEIARLAAAAGVAFNARTDIKGTLNLDVTARGAANNPALNGNLKANAIQISGGLISQPVTIPQVELTLTPTTISSNPFVAQTGGTHLNTQFALKDYTTQAPSVNASVRTDKANLGELLSMASAYGVSAVEGWTGSGTISLNMTAAGPLKNASAMVFSGDGVLQNASINSPALTKPLMVKNANIRFSQNSMVLENVQASLDQTNTAGSLSVRNFAAPQVQFAFNIDRLDLAAMEKIVATPAAPVKRASFEVITRVYAERKTTSEPSLITRATGSGVVNIGTLIYDQVVLNQVKSNVTLDRGLIRLSPLTSEVYGGQETGDILLDTRAEPPVVTVSTRLQRVDANKLLSSVSSVKNKLYGLLAANTNASFRAASRTEFSQSLNGKLSLDLSNGRIVGIDVLNQLATIGKFLNASSGSGGQQPFTTLTKLTGTFNVVNGVAQTNDLRAVIPGANLAASGTVNLVSNGLNMKLTAVLPKDYSQKVGGNGVGGFMQTALANKNGELVMPVIVTGTLDHPMVAPDAEQIAHMKLENLVPSFQDPGNMSQGILGAVLGGNKKGGPSQPGGLSGIIGALGGQQTSNQQPSDQSHNQQRTQDQGQATNPQNAVGDLFNQVLGGKKKKPPQQPPQ